LEKGCTKKNKKKSEEEKRPTKKRGRKGSGLPFLRLEERFWLSQGAGNSRDGEGGPSGKATDWGQLGKLTRSEFKRGGLRFNFNAPENKVGEFRKVRGGEGDKKPP